MYDNSDEDDELMPQVFAVDDVRDDDDVKAPPTTGQEYLRRVMKEAKRAPAIVVADIDSELLQSSHPFPVQICSSLHPAPHGYGPSLAWQKQQEAEFADVRQNFARYKSRLKQNKVQKSRLIPLKEDGELWCRLCFGRLNVRQQWRACTERGLQFKTSCGELTEDRNFHGAVDSGTPPLLSIVAYMDQATVMQVLKYHYDWLTVTGFTTEQGRWLYALLVCLEKPLQPDACSLLRDLARACSSLRATLENENDEQLVQLNLLICLVARYFSQTDLADPG